MRKKTLIVSSIALTLLMGLAIKMVYSTEYGFKSGMYNCDEEFGGQNYVGQYYYKENIYKFPGFKSLSITSYFDADGKRIDEPFMAPGCEKVW